MQYLPYFKPETQAFTFQGEGVVCGSALNFSSTEGSAGDPIKNDDIIQGGSF
ncbi:MAG: hypothetical protein IJ623_06410 [Bacteroidales bacterium]|nr:hypothetical protein [Bacteroidales bacterium]